MSKLTWTTEQRKLSELADWPSNPRQLSDHDAVHLAKSISRFSVADPLVINADNSIIGGHQRKWVMLGMVDDDGEPVYGSDALVDVRVPSRQLTENEAAELNVRLNRNTGEFDWEKLANKFNLDDLSDWGFADSDFREAGLLTNAPDVFPEYDEDIETQHKCPKCGYEWSGSSS